MSYLLIRAVRYFSWPVSAYPVISAMLLTNNFTMREMKTSSMGIKAPTPATAAMPTMPTAISGKKFSRQ